MRNWRRELSLKNHQVPTNPHKHNAQRSPAFSYPRDAIHNIVPFRVDVIYVGNAVSPTILLKADLGEGCSLFDPILGKENSVTKMPYILGGSNQRLTIAEGNRRILSKGFLLRNTQLRKILLRLARRNVLVQRPESLCSGNPQRSVLIRSYLKSQSECLHLPYGKTRLLLFLKVIIVIPYTLRKNGTRNRSPVRRVPGGLCRWPQRRHGRHLCRGARRCRLWRLR